MQRSTRAAAVSGAACAAFAAVLWICVAFAPSTALFVGASLTTSRAVTGFLIVAGIRFSRRRTRVFSHGLYKLENLIAVIIGLMIVIGAYELGRYSVVSAIAWRDLVPEAAWPLVFTMVGAALALTLGVYKSRVARAEDCVALRADAGHSFVDFAAQAVFCVGLSLDLLGVPIADAVAATVVSISIMWAGGSIAYPGLKVLLDASVERSVLTQVREIAAADPRVTRVFEVDGRNSGSFRFLTLRLATATDDVEEAEVVAADLKAAIRAQIRHVDDVVVELAAAPEDQGGETAVAAPPAPAGKAEAAASARDDVAATAAAVADVHAAHEGTCEEPSAPRRRPRLKPTERAEVVSVLVSIGMAAAMIAVAASAGSVAVLAEGTDTVVDVIASLVVLAGMRLAARHTKSFPQGLYKLENLVATGIGVLVLFSAYELGREAIARIISGEDTLQGPLLVIVVMAGVVAATAALAAYKYRIGRAHGSPSLLADARHAWIDTCASAGVALGVGLQWAGVPYMDSVAALVVVALLVWGGVDLVLGGLRVLLDASLEDDVLQEVRRCAETQPGVSRVAAVEGRNAGSYRFVTLRIVPEQMSLTAAERMADALTAAVRARVERIDRVTVELVAG